MESEEREELQLEQVRDDVRYSGATATIHTQEKEKGKRKKKEKEKKKSQTKPLRGLWSNDAQRLYRQTSVSNLIRTKMYKNRKSKAFSLGSVTRRNKLSP